MPPIPYIFIERVCCRYKCVCKFDEIEKSDNKQCLLDKKYAYIKAMALLRVTKGNNSNSMTPCSKVFIVSICLEDRIVFARFDEIPLMTL